MVSSVNTNSQVQYERKFSLGKAATSATVGALALKAANDAVLRNSASKTMTLLRGAGADEFIASNNLSKSAVKKAVKEAKQTLINTQYLADIKNGIKNPKTGFAKVKDFATNTFKNTNLKEIPAKAKGVGEKLLTSVKTLKGKTLKETLTNVLNATKTTKGKNALTLATGALCGLMLFGASKVVKKENQA